MNYKSTLKFDFIFTFYTISIFGIIIPLQSVYLFSITWMFSSIILVVGLIIFYKKTFNIIERCDGFKDVLKSTFLVWLSIVFAYPLLMYMLFIDMLKTISKIEYYDTKT